MQTKSKIAFLCAIGGAVAIASSCSDTSATAPNEQLPVVRAYLYANEPVNDIRLSYTAPIGTPDSLADAAAPPINNATVVLIRRGVRYALQPSGGDSGYYKYSGTNLTVAEGDVFNLEVTVGSKTITATTTVPIRPSGASVSSTTLTVPSFTGGRGGGPGGGFTPPDLSNAIVQVRWNPSSGALYYVTLENTETSPTAITTGFRFGPRRLIFSPTAADSFAISFAQVEYYGRHRVRVYRVNEEYAQLYATLQQDSRDLNEPATNIHGGLGVFSAFSSDTTAITVKQQ
jgi:hypothetical protein